MTRLLVFLAMSIVIARSAPLELPLRSRAKADGAMIEKSATWDPKKTALIVVDMWDDHWCKSAARRVVELAGPMNAALHAARAKGIFIIHAPSSVTDFYKGTPQRELARGVPFARYFTGHDLVIGHVERYWCPSFTSDALTGGKPFRFRDDPRP